MAAQEIFGMSMCIKELVGQVQFSPGRDVVYKLYVYYEGGGHEVKEATVQVNGGSGLCTISGEVSIYRREYRTVLNLYRLNSTTPTRTMRVDDGGRFSFTGVPAGIYRVVPQGQLPAGRRFAPSFEKVDCWPKDNSTRLKFWIGGGEG